MTRIEDIIFELEAMNALPYWEKDLDWTARHQALVNELYFLKELQK